MAADRSLRGCAIEAMSAAGFLYRHVEGVDLFLDDPQARARDAVHVIFAGERVRPEYPESAPTLDQTKRLEEFTVLNLEALVKMKLTSYRDKDRMHLRDLLEVGLIDRSWLAGLSDELGRRLQAIVDTPDG